MSVKAEELGKIINKEVKLPKVKLPKTNKGKKLRRGKFIKYKPYKLKEEKIINKNNKPFHSDITGKNYRTLRQMRHAEKMSIIMKERWKKIKEKPEWRLRKIKDIIGEGIDWEDLGGWKNTGSHKAGSILYEIFYENNKWDELTYDMIYNWYNKKRVSLDLEELNRERLVPIEINDEEKIGDYILMELPDIQGRTFYDFIKDVVKVPQNKIVLH